MTFSEFRQINLELNFKLGKLWTKQSSDLKQGWVYENGPAGIYSDAAGCGTVFENNVLTADYPYDDYDENGDDDDDSDYDVNYWYDRFSVAMAVAHCSIIVDLRMNQRTTLFTGKHYIIKLSVLEDRSVFGWSCSQSHPMPKSLSELK